MLSRLMRLCLPGLNDPQYARCDAEIEDYLALKGGRQTPGAALSARPNPAPREKK